MVNLRRVWKGVPISAQNS